jgi:hypothetical protein
VCGSNVKGMGTSFKIYANDNQEHWPTVPFLSSTTQIIGWTNDITPVGFPNTNPWPNPPSVTLNAPQPNRQSISSTTASVSLSVTRSMWMLVRSGDVTPKGFICPSSGNSEANEQNIDLFYDFNSLENVSYGYQVPYGPFSTRGSEDIDPRMAVAGDKGPYTGTNPESTAPPGGTPNGTFNVNEWNALTGYTSPQSWRRYNSPNHGGSGSGEGQNLLFGDGHADFERTPIVGIDKDNVYTKIGDLAQITNSSNEPIISGVRPSSTQLQANSALGARYPGYKSRNAGQSDASTDSLIYP